VRDLLRTDIGHLRALLATVSLPYPGGADNSFLVQVAEALPDVFADLERLQEDLAAADRYIDDLEYMLGYQYD